MSAENALTAEQVRHVAKLARLRLSAEEVGHYAGQLSAILGYIAKLNELNVEGVEPMAHALDRANVFRDDVPPPEGLGMDVEVALANAPQRDGRFFQVPKVLGEGGGA
jgi:aspartyl-tRNA(Asn)/glutamyl-tRNA(Gln) amidotransferase subunit C